VPCFIHDYPASQAALARVRNERHPVASRFEVYVKGLELANGFHELSSSPEQRRRFEQDNAERLLNHVVPGVIDEPFLAALEHGLPDCAGVALGIDRLIMLALKAEHIDQVISFPIDRA
jgi:lysyl-tRNA synthetase class 2